MQALDAANRAVDDVSNDHTMSETMDPARRDVDRHVPSRPDRAELAVLTALADTYGSEMLTNSSLGHVLRLVARSGGIALAKRVLFGESAADQQLSVMLSAARAAFTQVSSIFAEQFFAEANALIARSRPKPPRG